MGEVDEYYYLAEFSTLIQPIKSDKFKPVQMSNLIKKKRGGGK